MATKADDSSLDPEQLRAVEERAEQLLDRAAARGRFPTPIDDLIAAAKLKVAPTSIFNLQEVAAYLADKAIEKAQQIKAALSKLFGVYDTDESYIHIDGSLIRVRQNFVALHETGHHELPWHRKMFRFFQDCEKTLAPEIADQFEREANNFARCLLFQGDAFAKCANDSALTIRTSMRLAKEFGASQYAAAREFARTNHRSCVVYVLEKVELLPDGDFRALVRRVETSVLFRKQFGVPQDIAVTRDHFLAPLVPIGCKMRGPRTVVMTDLDGLRHECVADSFNTTWNVLILVYPKLALTKTTIILPAGKPLPRRRVAKPGLETPRKVIRP